MTFNIFKIIHLDDNRGFDIANYFLSVCQDLKKYNFYYWFSFPALCPEVNVTSFDKPSPLAECFMAAQVYKLIYFVFIKWATKLPPTKNSVNKKSILLY